MSVDPDARLGGSVAPPGWSERAAPVPSVAAVVVPIAATGQPATEAALRWRISAAILDNVLIYVAYLALCLLLHWRAATLDHWLVLLLLGVVYHLVLEARDGQTLGKRRYGIRVTAVDGKPPSRQAVALRSVLRIFDQFPLLYLSGLLNMVRTGPQRRQRLGDVAGGTIVVAVDGQAIQRGTPGWMLPASTLTAAILSAVVVFSALQAGRAPLTDTQRASFIAGCTQSSRGLINCDCLLNNLVAHGYDNLRSLEQLFTDARRAAALANPAGVPAILRQSALACRT